MYTIIYELLFAESSMKKIIENAIALLRNPLTTKTLTMMLDTVILTIALFVTGTAAKGW